MTNDEQMFIPRIHSKKAKVFAPLINQYGPALMAFVGRIVTCQEDAEDVVQETFVAAYEHLNDFDPEKASLKTWLHRLAYHEALHHLRRRKRLLELPLDVGEDIPDELPDTTTAERISKRQTHCPPAGLLTTAASVARAIAAAILRVAAFYSLLAHPEDSTMVSTSVTSTERQNRVGLSTGSAMAAQHSVWLQATIR